MSEIELKACPWCGRAPEVSRSPTGIGNLIMCNAHFDECPATPAVDEGTMESAARAWNTRAPQWQPIESAPKDGTFYLATNWKLQRVENCPPGHVAGIWHRIDGDWRGHALGDDSTHWQPLPAPPEVSNGQ